MILKVVVFVYYDIGCIGIEVLFNVGYEIVVVFIYVDDLWENIFYVLVVCFCVECGILLYVFEDVNYLLWLECIC